ncbi:hypothetical protein BD779DRAFT_1483243 [Infundibulicybe gibba]|nr:hypothetical protein BD779DRAFT_1483243 [Infundibulicybe gibba]
MAGFSLALVHRALLYSVNTGSFTAPKGKDGEFSKANWGDREVLLPGGEKKVERRSSIFLPKVTDLTEPHWEAIFDAALKSKDGFIQIQKPVTDTAITDSEDDDMQRGLWPKQTTKTN